MSDSLLIAGPPASGKSRAVLDRFLAAPDALVLTPSATMAEHLQHELARAGAAIRPSRVSTLAGFLDSRCARSAPPRALVHRLIRQALHRHSSPFDPIADSAGLHRSMAALLEEAPAAAFTPDLARIFRDAGGELESRGFARRASRLAEAAANPRDLPPLIAIDGFFAFSPAEMELIASLAARVSLIVTLPVWSGGESSRRALAGLGFREETLKTARRTPRTEVFSAPTLDREVEEIARRILQEAERGRPFREMGVVLRARDPYQPALETAFARFGIPARFYFGDPLETHPVIEYFSRLVKALLGGWDHAALLAALRMPVSGVGATPAGDRFDFALREKLPGAGLPLHSISPAPGVLDALSRLDPWRRDRAGSQEWSARLKTLRSLLPRPALEDRVSREQFDLWRSSAAALDAFDAVMDQTASILERDGAIALTSFWEQTELALSLEQLRIADRRRNVVHVMDVFEARQWELPVVFVCGLVERHFPQYHREDPLLGDAARLRAGLKTSGELQREERFLFELATTRATGQNILSFARFDEKGGESLPSFFLDIPARVVDVQARPRPSRIIQRSIQPASPPRIRDDASLALLGPLHKRLAPTAIESFLQCPFQFFAGRTLRLRPRPPAPQDRLDVRLEGIILHRALAGWSRAPLLGAAVLDEIFDEECRRSAIPFTYRTEAVRLELARHFTAFLANSEFRLSWISRVEEPFTFALTPAVSIAGRIDRLEIGGTSQALVVDYKHSAPARIRERARDDAAGKAVQGGLYLAAAEKCFGLEPAGMLYCGLRKEVTWEGWHVAIPGLERIGESVTREALGGLIAIAIDKAREAHEAITAGNIAPLPADEKKCGWCDFRDICRIESAARSRKAGA